MKNSKKSKLVFKIKIMINS